MTGILAINHYLSGNKFNELHNHLINSAEKCNINLRVKTNLELSLENAKADFVLFWDKDVNIARLIEQNGTPVFNSPMSIAKCDDKALTYAELFGKVPQPLTIPAPKTFFDNTDYTDFVNQAVNKLGLPLVFKECFGSFGGQVFLCQTVEDIMAHITTKPFLLQQFISTSSGSDKRLEIVDGVCVAATKRHNDKDFRSNVTNGGIMAKYQPTQSETVTAQTAANELGLLFCGVDILDDGSVCEVNSNAHIIKLMNATGIDTAPIIFDAIKRKI